MGRPKKMTGVEMLNEGPKAAETGTEALRKGPKKREISVVERRLKSGSIFSASSRPIPLTEPDRWQVRIVNSQISDNRLWEMQADKGWVYAAVEDLAISPHEIGFRVQDGRLVRGQHGHEILMKIERKDYVAIQKLKDTENRTNTFGDKAIKQAVLAAAAAEPDGARGAEFLERHLQGVSVRDTRGPASLED